MLEEKSVIIESSLMQSLLMPFTIKVLYEVKRRVASILLSQLVLSFIYSQIISSSRPHIKMGDFTKTLYWWR